MSADRFEKESGDKSPHSIWDIITRMNSTACILLLTNDPELENRWAEMLRTADGQIVRGLSRLTAKAPLDVVVTDRHLVSELVKGQNKRLARGEIGIVAVGSGGLADVNLPTDCTPYRSGSQP